MNFDQIKHNEEVNTYIRQSDISLAALGNDAGMTGAAAMICREGRQQSSQK